MDVHEVLKHPLLIAFFQIIFGGVLAYIFVERWQRWRQRRDFQYRALVKFSELTEEVFNRLSELLVLKDRLPVEKRNELRREYLYRRGPLYAMDGEIFPVFRQREIVQQFFHLRDTMQVLYDMACQAEPVSKDKFEPIQNCLAAQRTLMIVCMAREMRLFSGREARKALAEIEPKAKLPPGVPPPPQS